MEHCSSGERLRSTEAHPVIPQQGASDTPALIKWNYPHCGAKIWCMPIEGNVLKARLAQRSASRTHSGTYRRRPTPNLRIDPSVRLDSPIGPEGVLPV